MESNSVTKGNILKWCPGLASTPGNCFCAPVVHVPQIKDKCTRPPKLRKIILIKIRKNQKRKLFILHMELILNAYVMQEEN